MSRLDAHEVHDHLSNATAARGQCSDWIVANWPHLIELEQVSALIAQLGQLAHWSPNQSSNVRRMMAQLHALAVQPDPREERTIAASTDPSPTAITSAGSSHAATTSSSKPCSPSPTTSASQSPTELDDVGDRLHTSRRQARSDAAFARYGASTWEQAGAPLRAAVRCPGGFERRTSVRRGGFKGRDQGFCCAPRPSGAI